MWELICRVIIIIGIISWIYNGLKDTKKSVSIFIILKNILKRWKWAIILLIIFGFFLFYKKDIEGSLLVLVLILCYIIFSGNNGNSKIRDYQMKNHFSITIQVNIEELLKDSKLKDIYDDIFKDKKTLQGLSRKQLEKTLIDNQEKADCYKIFGQEIWHDFKFDILGDAVFCNGKPVLGGKIFGTVYIPYNKKEEIDGMETIGSGLTLRALVVNGLLKVQIGKLSGGWGGWGDVIKTEEKDFDGKSINLYENFIDIAIYPMEKYEYLYPLNINQYNASQKALEEDIKAGVYGKFYGKFMKKNKYLAEVEQERYITSVYNHNSWIWNSDDYQTRKVQEIEKSNPLDDGINKYVRIRIYNFGDNWDSISSRYLSTSF